MNFKMKSMIFIRNITSLSKRWILKMTSKIALTFWYDSDRRRKISSSGMATWIAKYFSQGRLTPKRRGGGFDFGLVDEHGVWKILYRFESGGTVEFRSGYVDTYWLINFLLSD